MLLGIGEIAIIIIITLALFLPELSKRRDKSSHNSTGKGKFNDKES